MPNIDDPPTSAAASVPQASPRVVPRRALPSSPLLRDPTEADWNEWFKEHQKLLKAFAMTQCRMDEGVAEDILQEAVVELWQKLDALPTDNQIRDRIRWRANDYYRLHENSRTGMPSPAPTESNTEMWDRLCSAANQMGEGFWNKAEPVDTCDHELVRAAVAGLKEPEQCAIGLYFSETPAPSWAKIASAMGCSAYIARNHCFNALRHLTSILKR